MVVERMEVKEMFGLPKELEVMSVDVAEQLITILAVSTQTAPCCPLCGTSASRLHSYYSRQLADMPCLGRRVRLIVHVRKFFCDEKTCIRKIFTERLAPFIRPWARVTTRLLQAVEVIGFATGGMAGARLGNRLGIQASWMTILRRMMALPLDPVGQVSQLGIDDFSFRRGHRFGTILVDLQRHQTIDLLPDRNVETAAAWMAAHPEIELVSRDRGGDYASAAAAGAPQAVQCADRFHLINNLGEALEGILARHLAAHRRSLVAATSITPLETAASKQSPQPIAKSVALSQAKREHRLAQYQQVAALREQGFSQTAIAEHVGIGHATVSRWLRHGSFPEQQPRPRSPRVDPHLPHLMEQWETGSYTVAQLHRELAANGYPHSYDSVYRRLVHTLPARRKRQYVRIPSREWKDQEPSDQSPHPPVLVRQAMFLFLRDSENLEADEQEALAFLRSLHAEVDQAYVLAQQFRVMLRTRTGEHLDSWIGRVKESHIRELQHFVGGVLRDKEAVKAGLTLPASQGIVEGKVNKLKLIKRMGYGRASFPLLRQRVLHAA